MLLSDVMSLPDVDVGAGNAKVKSDEFDDIANVVDRSMGTASHRR